MFNLVLIGMVLTVMLSSPIAGLDSIHQSISYQSTVSFQSNIAIQYIRTGIFVELSQRAHHVTQLHTMIYPSWLYVKSLSHFPVNQLRKHPQIQMIHTNTASLSFCKALQNAICNVPNRAMACRVALDGCCQTLCR